MAPMTIISRAEAKGEACCRQNDIWKLRRPHPENFARQVGRVSTGAETGFISAKESPPVHMAPGLSKSRPDFTPPLNQKLLIKLWEDESERERAAVNKSALPTIIFK